MVYKSGNSDYYLESHSINDDGAIMEGKPLLQETIQAMVDVFFEDRKEAQKVTGIIPDNVLHYGKLPASRYNLIWFRPAEKKVLHFSPSLKLPSEETWVPAMLYITNGTLLDVFALKSNARPTEKTKLWRAPFYNVSTSGNVCLGNADVKKPTVKTYASLIKYWEDLFWLSEFTHINGEKVVKTDVHKVWKKLLMSKCTVKWSDLDELLPTKITLHWYNAL